jgi:tetratricopeptide (TPR) repeat protein
MGIFSWIKTTLTFDRSWRMPFNRAIAASEQGDWDKAIAEYGEAIRVNPHSSEAFFHRAINYGRKRDWPNAIADCTEVVRINPRHLRAWHWRGILFRIVKDYAKALADFDRALELKPQYPRAWYDRGLTFHFKGDFSSAITEYTKAIDFEFDALAERALARSQIGELSAAWDDVTRAIRKKPTALNHYYAAAVAFEMKDFDEALAQSNVAVEKEPQDVRYRVNCSFCHHARGDYAEAIAEDEEVLRMDADNARAHNGLAWILATCPDDTLRNGAKALQHALKGYELGCEESPAFVGTLAAAYAESGNFPEAIRCAKIFVECDLPEENIEPGRIRLKLFEQGIPFREERGKMEVVKIKRTTPEKSAQNEIPPP